MSVARGCLLGRSRLTRWAMIVIAAAALVAVTPQTVPAQQGKPEAGKVFKYWRLICQDGNCAIAHRMVRAVMLFGYNAADGSLALQVRVPPDAPVNRPMALRLHKSGALLHLQVETCRRQHCVASAARDRVQTVIDVFAKENAGTLAYQLGQQLQMEVFSLRGFNDAIKELQTRAPKR